MKIREKNRDVQELIRDLNRHGYEKDSGLWKAVARNLNRPRRKGFEVNIDRIGENSKPKETVVVPGVVLGSGEIKKPVTVAALRFSGEARGKIEKAGGKCMEIRELLEKNPQGHKIRIMG